MNTTMNKLVELSIKDFKAIKRADILLDGITVVSGINGCGKSTMSKLLYYIFRNTNAFDELILEETKKQISPYIDILNQIKVILSVNGISSRIWLEKLEITNIEDTSHFFKLITQLYNRFIEWYNLPSPKNASTNVKLYRLVTILRLTLKIEREKDEKDLKEMLDIVLQRISEHLMYVEQSKVERPYKLLEDSLVSAFDVPLPKNITLKEYGDPIVGKGVTNVPLLHYIKKVAYIDTPMVIGMETFPRQPLYWKELNDLLKQPPQRGYKTSINSLIKEQIIKGDISFNEDNLSGGFTYKRKDGKKFDLLECATGIKSFSLLQLLLKNLFLGSDTLLIIDEPEAHLHPQWIVEYARLIVLLHKRIGVKFFIASHSTDMVSAIRYISEKEECLSSLSFYVAEEDKRNKDRFSYRSLGHDIEPIFESFNKSFERLDFYVGKK